ncbi:MAG TPA: DNA-binding domain-containing protein [Anaerohalosphaeraceae bacterium]|nr:DNA-binding domain-containing protein [Anaerohalosphaeraceae bacterium]HQG06852.1 DNA-binding domain-containing protein [Anaerohalosphaeraceae bacterium]HQI08455.1 DNA-binding domain-containing protein [Anaerohalosphaeraceae bacterium]HQJ68774.1 DNA-binding domain-containing protein [Anaerohalosphaeraceae bacterium]
MDWTIEQAAERLKRSPGQVRRMCETGRLPGAYKSGRSWRIPSTAHPDLQAASAAENPKTDLEELPEVQRQTVLRRIAILREMDLFVAHAESLRISRTAAVEQFAAKMQIPLRTLYRWKRQLRMLGPAGLADGRSRRAAEAEISPEAWEEFCRMYLVEQKPSAAMCWRNLCYINQSQQRGWRIPSLRRMQQLVEERIPLPVQVLHREGRAAYEAKFAPYLKTDPESIAPGAVWVGDHHQCDVWVRSNGRWVRPWITAWQDMRSRTIVGWVISEQPNSTTILQAFRAGCRQWGLPESVKIDNGKDYDCEMFTGVTKQRRRLQGLRLDEEVTAGLYALLGVGVSFAIPYHPQSKCIERWFDTLEQQFCRTFATWCGRTTQTRPEELFQKMKSETFAAAAPTLEDFCSQAETYIQIYNRTAHQGRGMDGKSPLEVMQQRSVRRVTAEGVLDLMCRCWSGLLTVGKNGIRIRGLDYGAAEPALLAWQGKKVRAAWDPEDLSKVWVYEPNTYKLICMAEQWKMVAYGAAADDAALRQARSMQARARKLIKQAVPAARTAASDLVSLTLAAMQARTRPLPEPGNPAIRPAATVMDGQVREHQRMAQIKQVRRAAGGEAIRYVADLQIDWEAMRTEPKPLPKLEMEAEQGPEKMHLNWD